MPEEIKPNVTEASTEDAKLAAEEIASGEAKAPSVDMEADYQAAQQFSVSEVDRTGEGAKAAQDATAPEYQMPEPEEKKTEAQPTGDPADFQAMAQEIGSSNQAVTNVSDDLVQEALKKGQSK
ncbi:MULTISPECIES: hypothetical protein [Fischerella]|jgi:hypothetical protein|uniref:Uncharacterized protein n=1 Tax=Fischerella muscicola CCMEE 5323 TaxID=2019572 RepID=A0A2N6K9C9_FISMU|nr:MULTISPECIES: hypothetical protein [Fischerella]MBD2432845.1 hypothetical protein [Fischerella sp. FACHB-380]PLZ94584.1 hypothetical protein CEN44_00335 [Fischerella muscicola CCMEE 5323]PMB51839.1 hypothetical protein CEN39_12945 [Fischerella thermalis CCMEE 5201]